MHARTHAHTQEYIFTYINWLRVITTHMLNCRCCTQHANLDTARQNNSMSGTLSQIKCYDDQMLENPLQAQTGLKHSLDKLSMEEIQQ